MQYKGAVFFDYDGTLADEREQIYYPTPTTVKALKALRQNGYMTVLASGRAKCYIPTTDADFDGYITVNGACAEVNGKVVHTDYFNSQDTVALIDKFDEMGLYYAIETREKCYAKDINNIGFSAMLDNFNIPKNVFVNLDRNNIPQISKMILVYDDDREIDELSENFKNKFLFYKHRAYPSVDVTKVGVDKSMGVEAICREFNIPLERTYAFGDGTNDYGMLKFCTHGIAMGEHSKVLDSVAEEITDTVANEGIYKALVKYGLIKCKL